MKLIKVVAGVATIAGILAAVGAVKKSGAVYRNSPYEQNPMEGKRVVFRPSEEDSVNADGVRGHLEVVGISTYTLGFYEMYVKRGLDVILSFCGLVLLSPLFLVISLMIVIDDPGPVLFTQKRIGKDKQYFRLHNIVSTKPNMIDRGVTTNLTHGCNEIAA